MDRNKNFKIKSRRDYVMEFSKRTGITDHKVDTFLKMEAEVNIAYDAVILGQERDRWAGVTYGVDYGEYLGSVFAYFGKDNVAKKEEYYNGEWSWKEERDDAGIDKFRLEYHKKNVPCRPRGKATLRDIKPY